MNGRERNGGEFDIGYVASMRPRTASSLSRPAGPGLCLPSAQPADPFPSVRKLVLGGHNRPQAKAWNGEGNSQYEPKLTVGIMGILLATKKHVPDTNIFPRQLRQWEPFAKPARAAGGETECRADTPESQRACKLQSS